MSARITMLSLAFGLALAACADDPETPREAADEQTSGGEDGAAAETTTSEPVPVSTPVDVRDPWAGLVDLGPDPTVVGTESAEGSSPFGEGATERCSRPPRAPLAPAARASFEAGLAAARQGDLARARTELEAALRVDPRSADATYNLGVVADRGGDDASALEHYRRALALVADHEGAALGTVRIHLRRGSPQVALSFIESLARANERNAYLQALLAETLVAAGRFGDAWAAARRALSCDERYVPALVALVRASRAQGRSELADAILTQALEIADRSPELHYLRGIELRARPGFLREALVELRRAIELRPDYAEARLALGRELLAGGSYAEAVMHLEAAHRLVPGSIDIRLALADAYRAGRRWAEALTQFQEVLRQQPTLVEARYDLALMYQAAGTQLQGVSETDALRRAIEEMEAYVRAATTQRAPANHAGDSAAQYLQVWRRQLERLERRRTAEAQEPTAPAAAPAAPAAPGGSAPPSAPATPGQAPATANPQAAPEAVEFFN